ncbi:hypothetical protein M9458_051102, partial [Cirrhinus mrigala]
VRRVTTYTGVLGSEPVPSQATVQDADSEAHFVVHSSPGLVCSHRPEGCVLLCLDSSSTQTVSWVCLRRSGIPVQSPPLRAIWGFRSTRRRVDSPLCRVSLSWHGVGFSQYVRTPHERAHSVSAELSEPFQTQDSGSSQTFSEAPGANGSRSRSYAARTAPYETTSALALWPNPEIGMAPRHVPGWRYPRMLPPFQPLVRPCLPTGRCAPGSGVEAHGCEHRCLQDGLGCRLQRADSFGLP